MSMFGIGASSSDPESKRVDAAERKWVKDASKTFRDKMRRLVQDAKYKRDLTLRKASDVLKDIKSDADEADSYLRASLPIRKSSGHMHDRLRVLDEFAEQLDRWRECVETCRDGGDCKGSGVTHDGIKYDVSDETVARITSQIKKWDRTISSGKYSSQTFHDFEEKVRKLDADSADYFAALDAITKRLGNDVRSEARREHGNVESATEQYNAMMDLLYEARNIHDHFLEQCNDVDEMVEAVSKENGTTAVANFFAFIRTPFRHIVAAALREHGVMLKEADLHKAMGDCAVATYTLEQMVRPDVSSHMLLQVVREVIAPPPKLLTDYDYDYSDDTSEDTQSLRRSVSPYEHVREHVHEHEPSHFDVRVEVTMEGQYLQEFPMHIPIDASCSKFHKLIRDGTAVSLPASYDPNEYNMFLYSRQHDTVFSNVCSRAVDHAHMSSLPSDGVRRITAVWTKAKSPRDAIAKLV
jgi:hypothetical protein